MLRNLEDWENLWYLQGFVIGYVEGFVKEYYKVDDFEWINRCSHDQLMRVFELTGLHLSYKEFKEAIMK